jgi:uncharacterized protein YecE (DUF72 family)
VAGSVHIGTSGWHYDHWRRPLYPEKLPASKMLDYYSRHFDTAELNNTFYRLPTENGLNTWRESTPKDFCFAAKGSRFITHMKKLKYPESAVEKYFDRVCQLGSKLGPSVFQPPPWWEADAGRLEAFLEVLPRRRRYAFELRNPTGIRPKSAGFSIVTMQPFAFSKSLVEVDAGQESSFRQRQVREVHLPREGFYAELRTRRYACVLQPVSFCFAQNPTTCAAPS